jgi:hypothetical protein
MLWGTAVTAAVELARESIKPKPAAVGEYRIDHLGIAVKSIHEALKFYSGQLGMDVSLREAVTAEKVNAAMLPVGGTALVWGPAAIWLFVDGRWGFGIFMVAWGFLLGGLDNVLRPTLISGRARISALAVFIGVLGGIPAFGAIGIIAGPVVLSLALALIEFAEESRSQIA